MRIVLSVAYPGQATARASRSPGAFEMDDRLGMIPEPMPSLMPIDTHSFAVRHLMQVTPTRCFAVLSHIAGLDHDQDGRVPLADVDLTRVPTQVSMPTRQRHLRDLLAGGNMLVQDGDAYVFPGAAEHDRLTCDDRHCAQEVAVARRKDEWYRVANRQRGPF